MRIDSGSRLGHYDIIGVLGAGGMGEVYRARDTRLGRNVAIKVLRESFSLDPERLRRFEKEARSASALNHPNIVTIYEVGSSDGVSFIAMELVEGAPLRAKIRGPLPGKTILQIACQIAAGLAAAHEAGIVHRDLKPENVMVTKDGLVKILDFGLAKLDVLAADFETDMPTATVTTPGIVLGTAAYMSPEQASGHPLDFRTDQFSLGSVLYEMATGKRPFDRPTSSQTQAAIIEDDPQPVASLNPQVPAPLRWIIERCLSKNPEDRYAATKDLERDLVTVRDHAQEMSGAMIAAPHPRRLRSVLVASLAIVAIVATGIGAWLLTRRDYFWRNPLNGARFTRFTDWPTSELDAAVSADGKFATFLSDRDGVFDVWIGQIGSGQFLNLTKGHYPSVANSEIHNVSFSEDATHVAFRVNLPDGKVHNILLVPTIGGTPRPFLSNAVEVAWSPDRKHIVFFQPAPGDPIFIADTNGANARRISMEKPGIHQHNVSWSPDGRYIYFVRGIPTDEMDVWRVPAAGGSAERLTYHNGHVRYPVLLDNRTLIYVGPRSDQSGSGLYTMDVEHRIPHLVTFGLEEYTSVSATADGQRMLAAVGNPVRDLWVAPITDHAVEESEVHSFPLLTSRAAAPRFGPDYVLYVGSKSGGDSLWRIKDAEELELWKSTEGSVPSAPAVSPDGRQICFLVRSQGGTRMHLIADDGTNVRELANSIEARGAPTWSPDGKWIAVAAVDRRDNPLFKVPVDGGAPVRLIPGADSVISNPVWSPDGRFILYSEGRGSATVRLRAITPDGHPFPLPEVWVGNTGDRYRFMPDGKSLVYSKGVLWLQNFALLNLATGQIRDLTHLNRQVIMKSFDVSPDGTRILFDRYRDNSDLVLIDLPRR
jgi:Tol biopolymer transport system component/predicted Ser/Thr protein kinase